MKSVFRYIGYAALAGLVATAPFVALEWIYSSGFPRGVPVAIFMILFVSATIFSYLAISTFRASYAGPIKEWIAPLLLKTALSVPFALAWMHTVVDQMPCFLGGWGC